MFTIPSDQMSSSYRVAHDPRKGRCALATKPLRAGTRLLRTAPFAAVSISACNACFSSNASLKRCGGCRLVWYCSRTCQQSDWTHGGHGKECAAWKQIPKDNKAPETVLLVTRLASALFLTPAGDQAANEQVLAMPHHFDDHTPEKRGEFLEMTQLVLLLLSRSKFNTSVLSFEELQNKYEAGIQLLFARLNCNAFTICEGASHASIGIGVFPEAALLNHSCDPNCVVSFVPTPEGKRPTVQLCIQVVQDVQEGEELTISYVELLESSKKRQLALGTSYFFECSCSRCTCTRQEPQEDEYLDGFCCSTCGEDGLVVIEDDENAVCRKCGQTFDAQSLIQVQASLRDLQANVSSPASRTRAWELAITRLHPKSSLFASNVRIMANYLIDRPSHASSVTALECLEREWRASAWILPGLPLPSRGLLHLQLARLLYNERNRREEAQQHIHQALQTLSCAYGENNAVVVAARSQLEELQRDGSD